MDRVNELAAIVQKFKGDRTRLIDILWATQEREGFVSHFDLEELGKLLKLSIPALREVMSFYHFFRDQPSGRFQIFLDTSIIAEMNGLSEVRDEFERQIGIKIGQTSSDGQFGLFETSCIGMSDQAPAALINLEPFTQLNRQKVKLIVHRLRQGMEIKDLVREFGLGDGQNAQPSVQAMVCNNLRQPTSFMLASAIPGAGLKKALAHTADEVIDTITTSGLRGRGGAGYPTGKKWAACRGFQAAKRYVVCNADEGEPGTFKDRLLLTEYSGFVVEGMAIAAHALSAKEGIIYLRAEYKYLEKHLQNEIERFRKHFSFDFDLRIQMGAGAYVCGEESALLESMEGKRGEPRLRPPFPVEVGYLGMPTVVNNVETFALVTQIFNQGVGTFRSFGTSRSPGVRLLSVSGDVVRPGIYEVPWGIKIGDVLALVGARNPMMIQVGGPSGNAINASDVNREISYEDLPTGGSIMVFSKDRDLFAILSNFMTFFVNESCGNCTPCRAGNVALRELLRRFIDGHARKEDLGFIDSWASIVKRGSRCGLGGSSPNVLTTVKAAFPDLFASAIKPGADSLFFDFNEKIATADYDRTIREMK
jgi:[NiFe] hydrogenase diaphorase moiety large subunit